MTICVADTTRDECQSPQPDLIRKQVIIPSRPQLLNIRLRHWTTLRHRLFGLRF
jgi:hypothetical protein